MARTVLLDGDPAAPQQARLGAALAARGSRVLVLDAPKVAAQIRQEFKQVCDEVRTLPRWTGPLRRWHLQRLARRHGVEVVHLNFVTPKQRAWADDPQGPPYVATVWGSDLNRAVFQRSAQHEAAIDVILRGASAVTSDAWPLLRLAQARMGDNRAPRQLVLWSADLTQFDRDQALALAARFRRELGIAPHAKVLLSPRQPQPHYHIERIVAGFARSQWRHQGVLVQKLHGKGGEDGYLNRVLQLASDLGVRDRVLLAPRLPYDELPGLYALGDAAVSLPAADGVPSTFLELMALQVPIVATDLPSYEGVLVENERALLVPNDDVDALARALDRLLTEPDLGPRLTANARQWALANADWARSVEQWVDLYEYAITQPRPGGSVSD